MRSYQWARIHKLLVAQFLHELSRKVKSVSNMWKKFRSQCYRIKRLTITLVLVLPSLFAGCGNEDTCSTASISPHTRATNLVECRSQGTSSIAKRPRLNMDFIDIF